MVFFKNEDHCKTKKLPGYEKFSFYNWLVSILIFSYQMSFQIIRSNH